MLSLKPNSDAINVTPKSTPTNQRKSLPCPPEAPPSNNTRTPFNSENLNGSYADTTPVRTYAVSTNCLCPQCGATCRNMPHTPVSKTPITVDRGILC